jgi:hypothetical protein
MLLHSIAHTSSGEEGELMSRKNDFIEIFLVPGFLGFKILGDLPYFLDVQEVLERELDKQGITAHFHPLGTDVPAGSLRLRAARLAKAVAAKHSAEAKSVHFVGHSTGGLDIRMLLSPGGAISSKRDLEKGANVSEDVRLSKAELQNFPDALDKTKTAISVATPHRGTPIANVAMRFAFDRILRISHDCLAKPGPTWLLSKALQLGSCASKPIQPCLPEASFLNWIITTVLSENPEKVVEYLQQAGKDVGALRNLTQEGMDLGDALLLDRKDVHYASIISGTNEPTGIITTTDFLLWWTTVFYRLAWHITARKNPDYPYAGRDQDIDKKHGCDRLNGEDVGELTVDDRSSDGVVPTRSQAYGEILGVFASDHLDCVGHFPHYRSDGQHVSGWVRSGAGFNGNRHELLWGRVAKCIAAHK